MTAFFNNTSGTGTWTPPPGVTSVTVEIWGGGGGGGTANNSTNAGSGAGGGAYTRLNATVAYPTGYSYAIGAGGTGGAANNSNGVAGGNSNWNNNQITAPGGAAGIRGRNAAATAGGANNNTNADASYAGGGGANHTTGTGGGGGGAAGANSNGTTATSVTGAAGGGTGGGASNGANGTGANDTGAGSGGGGGAGGAGGTAGNSGNPGGSPGGGGGAAGGNSAAGKVGGAGANGAIQLTYTLPTPTQTNVAEVGLQTGTDPGVYNNWSINIRGRVQTSAYATFRADLYQGATKITSSTLETAPLTTTITTYQLAILTADASSVAWTGGVASNLRIEFSGYSVAGATPTVEVEDLWLDGVAPSASVAVLPGRVVSQAVNRSATY